MKKSIIFVIAVVFLLTISCTNTDKKPVTETKAHKEVVDFLPFRKIELENMSAFQEVADNWKIVGSAYVNRSKDNSLEAMDGTGVLVNIPNEQNKGHLFTGFDHGDIELEVDIMMPKGSNSGLYFQGRYEVQLFDSWGKGNPEHSDMGGIYHRWDASRGEGKKGFEGHPPKINAAKAPGLWQHFKIIFHAPKFDSAGKKIKNAEFQEVWLNGVLVQKNVEVSGPTRASAFEDEQPKGPFMVQGDHGPVALKNIKYKLYNSEKVRLDGMTLREYPSDSVLISELDSLTPLRKIAVDTMAASMVSASRDPRILRFSGKLLVPETGNYLFDYRIHDGGGLLIIENDTVVNFDGDYTLDSLGVGTKQLNSGEVPFELIYNKHRFWRQSFSLEVEGPGIQKQPLQAPSSLERTGFMPEDVIMVDVTDEVKLQRSFWMHNGKKRTHCISVGTPLGIHYAYDLAHGALLQVWNGDFFDATEMWLDRGEKQLGMPAGFTVSFHGDPEFVILADENTPWPKDSSAFKDFKSTGYTLDSDGLPTFTYQNGNTAISDKLVPSKGTRALNRTITFKGNTLLTHKIAEGNHIVQLADGTFVVNDESYFIKVTDDAALKPVIRKNNGKEELIVNIPEGNHNLIYSIIW